MQKREKYLSVFIVLFILAVLIFALAKTNIFSSSSSFVSSIFSPIQAHFFKAAVGTKQNNLKEENLKLVSQMSDYQRLKDQNKSLLDQFQTTTPKSTTLLQAEVVGAPSFIPGLSYPENLIINRGEKDGVKVNQAVVLKNNLIGRIEKVTPNLSLVLLVTNNKSSFTAVTKETNILGVVKGQGSGELILDNVLLSENLKDGDLVLTKGDVSLSGEGIPLGLIVGKIISVEKRPSALFQKAQIEGLVDVSRLSTVFVIVGQ